MPVVTNTFVRESLPVSIPPLVEAKSTLLRELLGDRARPLVVGGFGYDASRMASALKESHYVATSKAKEIIVDGKQIPLPFHISAEEVMLAERPSRLVCYAGTVPVWAKCIHPELKIDCYRSSAMEKSFGSLYTVYARKTLKQIGIDIQPEQKEMLYVS